MAQKKKAPAKVASAKISTAKRTVVKTPPAKVAKSHSEKPKAERLKSAAKSQQTSARSAGAKIAQASKTAAQTAKAAQAIKAQPAKPQARKPAATENAPVVAAKPAVKLPEIKLTPAKPAAAKVEMAQPPKAVLAKPPVAPHAHVPAQQARAVPAAVAKPNAQRITAPMTPKDIAQKAVEARQSQSLAAAKKPVSQRHGFKTNEYVVYPAHGVGRIVGIEEQEIAGMSLELFVITFDKDKMTLRVPTGKLQSVGMRKLSEEPVVRKAMETLKGRARIKRTMWSRRAQEYEAKINSGDLVSIAEVVRDLYRSESQPEQSYSERQLYEAALDRMAREVAAVDRLDERGAVQRITEVLSKSARGRRLAAETAEAEAAEAEAAVKAA